MTQTKKKTLTVFAITLILLLVFIITFVGQSAESASADSTSAQNDTQTKLDSIMSNGEVHGNTSTEGKAISTPAELREFLTSGDGKGYLTRDIDNFFWDDNRLTSTLSSVNMTELNGNGHTITLTATGISSNPAKHIDTDLTAGDKGSINWTLFMTTFFAGENTGYTNYIDLHGGLIGFLRNYQTIKNCNFVYTGNIDTTYATRNSGTMGLIAALSLGTIDNCSLTVNGKIKFYSDTTWTGAVGLGTQYNESMFNHSFALGGFVGTMTASTARVSNSKITLNNNFELSINARNKDGSTAYHDPFSRCWAGGIVGWMANSAQVYNIVTEGSGNLDARGVNDQANPKRSRSFSGIIAGISGGDGSGGQDSLAGLVASYGIINGVINNWTGYAKFLTYDTQYSPTGVNDNSIQYLIIGVAGMISSTNPNVSNIYMNKDVYSGTTFSIAFDYTMASGTNGVNKGRYLSTNILMKDVLNQSDGSTSFSTASSSNAYLAFAGTSIESPIWAVYDISKEDVILWSKSVTNMSSGITDLEYYFDQATSIEDAKKFDVTHTEISRGQNQNYEIKYTHGKAVFFTKSYPYGADETNPDRVVLGSVQYGEGLTAPTLNLYYDKDHTKYITELTEKVYWASRSSKNNVISRMSDISASPDTYESFLYLENADGRNYNYIQFINTTFRYVSYIYDDPVFNAYLDKHPGYEPVKDNEKLIDWQQRVIQTVDPRSTSVDWKYSSDIVSTGGIDYDPITGEVISYGKYKTTYDGDPVVFDISVPQSILINNETCTAIYEYRMLDEYSGEYNKIDSCVNAGTYKVVVTGLSNSNYALAGTFEYCIDFVIEKRQIGLKNKLTAELEDDAYYVKVPYEARNINLADDIDICVSEAQANVSGAKIAIYNVLEKDKSILQFEYAAYGDGELNMRNVGKFEMIMSLISGINSGNYALPEVTKYLVEIIPADAIFSTKTQFEYPYGYFVSEKVDKEVTVTGVDGLPMRFGGRVYYALIDGDYEEISYEPIDAGIYRIEYQFRNDIYSNYNENSIVVDVTISPRIVYAEFDVTNRFLRTEYNSEEPISYIDVKFSKQSGDDGIILDEYKYSIPTFVFKKLDANGHATGEETDEAVNAGTYLLEVGIDFKSGITSNNWVIDENTYKNYEVRHEEFIIIIEKKTVYIDINEYDREYGSALPEFIGDANAAEKVRAWSYTDLGDAEANEKNKFYSGDNIVLLPLLSTLDVFAFVGNYAISIPEDVAYRTDKAHIENPDLDAYNKIDNYIIIISNEDNELYTIKPRTVKVKVYLNTNSVIYSDALPEFLEARVVGENGFFEQDGIQLVDLWDGVEVGSSVGTYYVSVKIVEMLNNMHKNYVLDIEEAEFEITPMTLTLTGVDIDGEQTFNVKFNGGDYDGMLNEKIKAHFAEIQDYNNNIGLVYDYFEVIDGVTSTEATVPRNAGEYRVFISDIDNPNYTLVFDSNYVRGSVKVVVEKLNVKIDVLPAYRIYSVTGSLTPIMRGEIHEEDGWHYYSKEEAEAIYGEDFYKPYRYAADTVDQFVQNEEDLKATMYIDEYYKELGIKYGVVKLVFDGLVPDPEYIDENGNWKTEEAVGVDGEIIQIIMPRYRNYNIEMNFGDLHVLGGNLSDVERYVSLRSYEQVYNGQDRYDDFRVITSNDNIANALKISVFKYVAISSLSKSEADALANANGGKYTQIEEDGKIVYVSDNEAGTYVRKFFRRVENGDSVSDQIVDAGQYFVYIAPADADAGIFDGISDSISFTITKAERQVTAEDIKVSVNYNQIRLSSSIEGMEVSFNGAGYVNRNTFVDLNANTSYVVKVRFAETANYKQSQEITLNLHTGIDISAIQSTLDKFDKIDFSNISEYESKVLAFIGSVSQEDMLLIDQAKFAKLQASYEQLLRGANSVIAGAQKAGATAIGKAGKTNTAAKTVALSMSGVGMLFAGLMFFAKKKKEDGQEEASKKAKRVNVRKAGKVLVMAVAVVLVCLTIFAGCTPSGDNGEFSKADLYRIASYQSDGQTGKRDLTIEVTSGGMTLYKYENGNETVDDRLDVSSIEFGADGIGFEFDDLYFENAQFDIEDGIATFNADIKETLVFLGVNNAVNGKVSVAINTETKSLNTIDVSYDVVSAGITYSVTISVKVN